MKNLSEQINIGKKLERKLIEAGVASFAELKNSGSEQAFLRLWAIRKDSCLCKLYALEGAIVGIRWHDLPVERKEELKAFYQMIRKVGD